MAIYATEKIQAPVSPTVHKPKAEYDTQALPRIELDASLGHLVDHIEVDANYFANLMASKGLSDSDIAETTMFISASTVIDGEPTDGDSVVEGGHHDPTDRTIQINVGSVMAEVDYMKRQHEANGPIEDSKIDEVASVLASEKAVHELSHRIDAVLGNNTFEEKLDYYDDLVPEKLLGRVLRRVLRMSRNPEFYETADLLRKIEIGKAALKDSNHEHYKNSPEERRADQLSDEAVRQFDEEGKYPITITFKKPFPQTSA